MKKNRIKISYKLKILNDGSSIYIWTYPWLGWEPFTNQDKDLSIHPLWNPHLEDAAMVNKKPSHLEEYTKKIKGKKLV